MKNTFKTFKAGLITEGSFLRNIAIFTSGSLLAYLIGFVFTPIITRIYSPEDYGRFAFFNTILAILFSVSTLNYSEALILPKKTKDFHILCRLILTISFIITILFTAFLLAFNNSFVAYFNMDGVGYLTFLIPVLLMFSIFQIIADNHNIRKKQFSVNSKSKIASVIFSKGSVAIIGLKFGSSVAGLISGEIIIRGINYFSLLGRKSVKIPFKIIRGINWDDLKRVAEKYRKYPIYIFPSSLLLQFSLHFPIFIISKTYSSEMLGFYSLALTLLGIPIQIIGFSVGKVFLQKANEIAQSNDGLLLFRLIIKLFYFSLVFSIAGYGIVYFFGQWIFHLIAGEDWNLAGRVAVLLSPGLAVQLVATIVMPSYRVLRIERLRFASELIGSGILAMMVLVFAYMNFDFMFFMFLFSILLFLKYLITIGFLFRKIKTKNLVHLTPLILLFLMAYAFLFESSF